MLKEQEIGYCEGDTCGREPGRCTGTIQTHPTENCSCHINAPCSQCTAPRNYCDKCGWEEADDRSDIDHTMNVDRNTGAIRAWHPRKLDPTKIDYRTASHSSSSMIKEGVYPEGTTQAEVLEKVRGTFGGRFEHFGNCRFKYIAYTD